MAVLSCIYLEGYFFMTIAEEYTASVAMAEFRKGTHVLAGGGREESAEIRHSGRLKGSKNIVKLANL
jgi:hypothetical protein